MSGPTGIDDLLDAGAVGLRFFAEFLPRAHRIGAASTVTMSDLTDRYEAQRGLDVARLASDADAVRTVWSVLGTGVDEQRDRLASVPAVWEGGASCSASDPLAAHLERSRRLHDTVGALADTLVAAASAIGVIVDEKSRAAATFADPVIGGLGPADVDAVLAGASGAATGPTGEQLARWSTGLAEGDSAAVAQWCSRWLNEVFVPGVETAAAVFACLCDDADRAIGAVFDELARAFDALDEHRFPGVGTDLSSAGRSASEARDARETRDIVPAWGSPGATPADMLRAGVSLVESGLELATAVGEWTGAVVELATAVVEAVTERAEAATDRVEAAAAEVPDRAAVVPDPAPEPQSATIPPTDPAPPAEVVPPTEQATPSADPATPADVLRAVPAAEEPPAATTVPGPGVPGQAVERGRSGRSAPGRAGVVARDDREAADREAADRGPAESAEPVPDGGVILPEAGPL
ncbi:hypothetical protein M1M07_29380 [Rhodococcus sp. HM1]|uniref:hypothetical protein n=1 Tax=Rhodococcus sp. HM1 TaxID=2937759 RepID=UPI00200A1980|nr:hypothetical protein [Rhodococcus sp. HM1]MCK8675208.1 hypothetical protein [Rhodococcus sp. HM1]